MSAAYAFSKEEMAIDASLGYPRAYAKLCKDTSISPYTHGPPFIFTPYTPHSSEASRAKELDEMFPIIDPEAKPTGKTRMFLSILWKQLNHLGNAGFDPAMFRVDPYGNVLYLHADSASPLAWAIDHWFPCSRGGLTVPSNLRILQWQVCKRKHNQLEFLVPWWDLQIGISINQFLSIFAASNSDFRHRAFRLLFSGGENEELNDVQTVDSHNFPQPFLESKEPLGLAPAAIVRSKRDHSEASSSTLRSLDINRQQRPSTPIIAAARKFKNHDVKENVMPDMATNPYQAIVMARDSLKQREGTNKMKAEIQRLDDEVIDLKLKNEEEKLTIQELEMALIKRKRRAEKCRKLAEAQSSHRAMLEKMIRNAMHQSVVYKEQVRLNQAATQSLMARLEAQMVLSNAAEKELYKKYKQRDEIEKQIRPEDEQVRKRSRIEDCDGVLTEEKEDRTLIYLPRISSKKHLHKELRVYLEEEQKLSEAALSLMDDNRKEEEPLRLTLGTEITEERDEPEIVVEGTSETVKDWSIRFPFAEDTEEEEDEESRKNRGKGNVEKWLEMLLEDFKEGEDLSPPKSAEKLERNKTDEIIKMLNEKYPQKEIKFLRLPESVQKTHEPDHGNKIEQVDEMEGTSKVRSISTPRGSSSNEPRGREPDNGKNKEKLETEPKRPRSMSTPRRSISSEADIIGKGVEARKSFGWNDKWNNSGKDKGIARCESARSLRPFPSSPSMIMSMRKGVDCMRKKPLVLDDEDEQRNKTEPVVKNFLKSPFKSIKKDAKI